MTYNNYCDYFEKIAKSHKLINHTDKSKSFVRLNIEEFWSGYNGILKEKGIVMLLYNYEKNFTKNNQGGSKIMCDGGFAVIGYYKKSDYQKEQEVLDKTERICFDILKKMQEDSVNNIGFFNRSFDVLDNISLLPFKIEGALNYSGFQVLFKYEEPVNFCEDKSNWL